MERIFETLPAAKKWSLILLVISAVILFFSILGVIMAPHMSTFISTVMQGFLTYFLFTYQRACHAGIYDESEESLEEACRGQKNILLIYGLQAIFMLLTLFIIIIPIIVIFISYVPN